MEKGIWRAGEGRKRQNEGGEEKEVRGRMKENEGGGRMKEERRMKK